MARSALEGSRSSMAVSSASCCAMTAHLTTSGRVAPTAEGWAASNVQSVSAPITRFPAAAV
ncbi:MAG TPA: hypothetical protein VHF45_00090 [Thermoleophilaceae bacterium]|jgi:hypothetical protein|nr:hypothetical protein [Thermoleophilaceae bacterium]